MGKVYINLKESFIDDYKEGMSIRAISNKYDVNKGTVSKYIQEEIKLREKTSIYNYKNEILSLYKKNLNNTQIAKKINDKYGENFFGVSIKRLLAKEFNIDTSSFKKYEELIPTLVRKYKKGYSLEQLSSNYNISKQTILEYLNLEGIKARNYHESSLKTDLNERYFDDLDKEKAYELGIIFITGKIFTHHTSTFLELSCRVKNSDLILKAIKNLSSKTDNNFEFKDNSTLALRINSKYLCDKLNEYGINKKINIPNEFKYDFYKGVFESTLTRNQYILSFPSRNLYLDDIKRYLIDDIGVYEEDYKRSKHTSPYIRARRSIEKFLKAYPQFISLFQNSGIKKWENMIDDISKS